MLVPLVCYWILSKYHDVDPLGVNECVSILPQFSQKQFNEMEQTILFAL